MESHYLSRVGAAVQRLAGINNALVHEGTSHVHEMMDGKTVWKGDVETWHVADYPPSEDRYFAWEYGDDDGEIRYIVVKKVPPINSPREAVQAAIASGRQR